MSAPCRSSIAHARAAIRCLIACGPPGRRERPKFPLPEAPPAPFRGLKTPIFKTPERPLGQKARDRPLSGLRAPRGPARSSLELDLRADLLQGGLDLLGLFLADAFLDGLRRAFDEVLGLLQAERGDRADFLDDLDLLFADGGENDGELGLLLDRRRGGGAGGGSGGDRNRGGGRDAPFG